MAKRSMAPLLLGCARDQLHVLWSAMLVSVNKEALRLFNFFQWKPSVYE